MKISVISLCFVKVGRLMALWLSDEGAYSLSLVDRFIAVIAKGCKCLYPDADLFANGLHSTIFMLRLKLAMDTIEFSVSLKTSGKTLFHHRCSYYDNPNALLTKVINS